MFFSISFARFQPTKKSHTVLHRSPEGTILACIPFKMSVFSFSSLHFDQCQRHFRRLCPNVSKKTLILSFTSHQFHVLLTMWTYCRRNLSVKAVYTLRIFIFDSNAFTYCVYCVREGGRERERNLKMLIRLYIWHTLFFIRINIDISFVTKWNHKYQNILADSQLCEMEKPKRLLDVCCALKYVLAVVAVLLHDYAYNVDCSKKRQKKKSQSEQSCLCAWEERGWGNRKTTFERKRETVTPHARVKMSQI